MAITVQQSYTKLSKIECGTTNDATVSHACLKITSFECPVFPNKCRGHGDSVHSSSGLRLEGP